MVTNALLAAAVGDLLGISPERIAEGIEACALSQKRMAVIRANGLTVIDDTYNANPASVRAAVEVLSMDGSCRRVCVLGDMLELGERAENLHRELGRYIAQKNIEVLIAAGGLARFIYDGYAQEAGSGQALYFDSKAAFLRGWRDIIHEGDAVLVKASRGMAFEDIVSEMTQT